MLSEFFAHLKKVLGQISTPKLSSEANQVGGNTLNNRKCTRCSKPIKMKKFWTRKSQAYQ